jgi:hypothetical protein
MLEKIFFVLMRIAISLVAIGVAMATFLDALIFGRHFYVFLSAATIVILIYVALCGKSSLKIAGCFALLAAGSVCVYEYIGYRDSAVPVVATDVDIGKYRNR